MRRSILVALGLVLALISVTSPVSSQQQTTDDLKKEIEALKSTLGAMQKDLQQWILQYVDGDPANSSEATKAQRPLAAAEIVVEEVAGNPGYYTSKFFLRPHYQLEGLSVSLRLTSKLPSAKAA